MGLFYEALRFFRMILRHNIVVVCIEDTLYMSICAFTSFVIALSVGIGYMRIYYIVFEAIGAAVYFLTVGRLLNYILRRISGAAKHFVSMVAKKTGKGLSRVFIPIGKKISRIFGYIAENVKKGKMHLKKSNEIEYNEKAQSIGGGERTSVVKAKIRKKE